jgi:simple sugar transport system ATP-binding protein
VTQTSPSSADARAAAGGAPLLRLRGITKRFGALIANDRISLDVAHGEIHGLLGENGAGKTTLVNLVYGLLTPDAGSIEIDGERVEIESPRHALELGVGMVHQHFMLVQDMTVAENVALGLGRGRPTRSHVREVAARLRELSAQFGLQVDPAAQVEELSVGTQQRVEILKLLYRGARLLILDEPTAALTPGEWQALAGVLEALTGEGKGIVFITHKLDEVFGVADRCTVLRDGAVVGMAEMATATKPELARMMVGRPVTLRVERPPLAPGRTVLEVQGLTLVEDGRRLLDGVSFEIREREILGIAGVDGNGQRELVETLIGLRERSAGTIAVRGAPLLGTGPLEFSRRAGAVVPEDRHRSGIALELPVRENLMLKDAFRRPFSRLGVLRSRIAAQHCSRLAHAYDIRAGNLDAPAAQLSGGNQQKVVLARELHTEPELLIAAQPTRGLDVGAMEFVYSQILEHRARGGATLFVSIELDEILSLSDRIAVMFGGRFLRVLDAADADPESLGLLMAGAEVAP